MPSIPKPVKRASCRLCDKPRCGLSRLCRSHWLEKAREKKEASRLKKLDRKLKSKRYQDGERKKLIGKCDAVFSLIVRSVGVCLWCGKRPPEVMLNASHIFSRRYMAIRWEEKNCKSLCVRCHRGKWHAHPAEASVFLATIRTPEEIKWLQEQANSVKQWTTSELKSLFADLTARLKNLPQ